MRTSFNRVAPPLAAFAAPPGRRWRSSRCRPARTDRRRPARSRSCTGGSRAARREAISALLGLYTQQYPGRDDRRRQRRRQQAARAAIGNSMSRRTPPDTFQANGGWDLMAWVLYNGLDATQSKMQELDPATLDWMDQVPDPVLSSVSYKGKVYAVPLNIHRLNTFFYNKDDLQERRRRHRHGPADLRRHVHGRREDQGVQPDAPGRDAADHAVRDGLPGDGGRHGHRRHLDAGAAVLREHPGGAHGRRRLLQALPRAAGPDDAFQDRVANALADFRQLVSYSNLDAKALPGTRR